MSESRRPFELYLLYGAPASGKSTLARRLENEQGLRYISFGEIARLEIEQNSSVGKQLLHYLDEVVEYPPKLISEIITNRFSDVPPDCSRVLLDGFPKYPAEVPLFLQMIRGNNMKLVDVIVLEGPPFDELLRRVRYRLSCTCGFHTVEDGSSVDCPQCGERLKMREDDKESILRRRYNDHISSIENTLGALDLSSNQIIRLEASVASEALYRSACRELSFHLPE